MLHKIHTWKFFSWKSIVTILVKYNCWDEYHLNILIWPFSFDTFLNWNKNLAALLVKARALWILLPRFMFTRKRGSSSITFSFWFYHFIILFTFIKFFIVKPAIHFDKSFESNFEWMLKLRLLLGAFGFFLFHSFINCK